MDSTKKAIVLIGILAVSLPMVFASKALRWQSPRGVQEADYFNVAVLNLAQAVMARQPQAINAVAANDSLPPAAQETITPSAPKPEIIPFQAAPKPYRVLLVGDSFVAVAGGFGDIMEQKLIGFSDVAVKRSGKVSSGLSRPDFFDWNIEADLLIKSFQPTVVVVMMGTNDAQSFDVWVDGRKTALQFASPQWDEEYSKRVSVFIKRFTDTGAVVYWVGLPSMRDKAYDGRISHVAGIYQRAAAANTQAKFISSRDLLSGGNDAYLAFLPDDKGVMRAARNSDGIHLSYHGGTYLVGKLIDILKKDIDLIPSSSEATMAD